MIDTDFIRFAISEKQNQAQIAIDPKRLSFEINLLNRRLVENDNKLHRLPCEQASK